jgi:hypothetical protein
MIRLVVSEGNKMIRIERGIGSDSGKENLSIPSVLGGRDERSTPQRLILREEVAAIVKKSRYERDLEAIGGDRELLYARYREMGDVGYRIIASHSRQTAAVERCREVLGARGVHRLSDSEEVLGNEAVKAVIVLGGDDFFKLVGQSCRPPQIVLGVNSDPQSSRGALLSVPYTKIEDALTALEEGRYRVEPWTKAAVTVDGVRYPGALNDIVVGRKDFRLMSHHELHIGDEVIHQASSGLLISTGVGSTGWYSSAGLYLGTEDRSFPRSAPFLRFELREPAVKFVESDEGLRVPQFPRMVEGTIEQGATLRIVALNDGDGILSRDSTDEIPFNRGSVAEVSVDPEPLLVCMPEVPV